VEGGAADNILSCHIRQPLQQQFCCLRLPCHYSNLERPSLLDVHCTEVCAPTEQQRNNLRRTSTHCVVQGGGSVLGSIIYHDRTAGLEKGCCGCMVIGCGHAAKGCAKTRHVSCGTTAPLLALSRSSIDNDALTGSHGHHHGLPTTWCGPSACGLLAKFETIPAS